MEQIINIDDFWLRLKTLLKSRKVKLNTLCKDIGTPTQNMKNKKYRKTLPTMEELVLISSYFNVSLDFLILGKSPDSAYLKYIQELKKQLNTINRMTSQYSNV